MEKMSEIQKYNIVLDTLDINSSHGKVLSLLTPESTILECGCSTGYMTRWMKENLRCEVSVIEIDESSFQMARPFAADGYCGSLMDDGWFEYYQEKRFDFILFADVLEHLSDPDLVLKKANTLLKDDGKIIISIPNIAHNDIILKLAEDQFTYTNIGLLDNSHVHFWGRNNLENFFKEAGLAIVRLDGTFAPTSTTEQFRGNTEGIDYVLLHHLLHRPLGEVYQYILMAQKASYVEEHHISCVDLLPEVKEPITPVNSSNELARIFSTVYFSESGVFSQENCSLFHHTLVSDIPETIKVSFDLPQNCRKVRFDPCEGRYCIVEHVKAFWNDIPISWESSNGTMIGNMLLFATHDPQIFFDIPEDSSNGKMTVYFVLRVFNIDQESFIKKVQEELAAPSAEEITCTVYFDEDGEFSEEKAITHSTQFQNSRFDFQFDIPIPDHCKKIRIDPCEGRLCALSNVRLIYQGQELVCTPLNGFCIDHMFFFSTEDPQLEVVLPDGAARFLYLDMTVRLFDVRDLTVNAIEKQIMEDQRKLSELYEQMKAKEQQFIEQMNAKDKQFMELQTIYDQNVEELSAENQKTEKSLKEAITLGNDRQNQIESLSAQITSLQGTIHSLTTRCNYAEQSYAIVTNAFFWKITKPARALMDWLKKIVRKHERLYLNLKTLKWMLHYGPKEGMRRRQEYLTEMSKRNSVSTWPSKEERERQRAVVFPKEIKFSVLVPLYNTPEKFLREMIESVQNQTYTNWELCLADGSDSDHANVSSICNKYAKKDSRILYKKLDKNLGISGNTNACIDMSTGDYFALFDHDDILHPSALFEVMKAICEQDADFIYSDEASFASPQITRILTAHFKPDFAPDNLRSYNYICHLSVFSKELLDSIEEHFRSEYDGSQDYDLILRLTEKANKIVHIPRILYYWRSHENSTAENLEAKPYAIIAAKKALADHLERIGLEGTVEDAAIPSTYRIQYKLIDQSLISILIPNKDHRDDLKKCIDSIIKNSTYVNYEIIIIENNSEEESTFLYYEELKKNSKIQVVVYDGSFNYAAINNFGVQYAKGDYLLLLNNDTEVITPDWLEQMLMFAQRKDVGAVGSKLYYPDDTIQHAGVIVGIGGVAGHAHKCFRRDETGFMGRLLISQDLSAVTGACVMIPKRVWQEVGGLDEKFVVAFNDVDLCLRIREAGYLIVWTPYAELYHYESKSRGYEDTPEKIKRFEKETALFRKRWAKVLKDGDPYYNPNLTLDREDFGIISQLN